MIKIYINDNPCLYAECHSTLDVETFEDAAVVLWVLANNPQPEFATCFLGEWHDNRGMTGVKEPTHKALIDKWRLYFDIGFEKPELTPTPALIYDGTEGCENDYTLADEYVWITVGNTTIYIRRDGNKVQIEVSPLGREDQQIAILTTTQPEQ